MNLLNNIFSETVRNMIREELKQAIKEAMLEVSEDHCLISQQDDIVLDRKEASEFLRISLPTLDRYSHLGILKGRKLGNKIIYKKSDLLQAGKTLAKKKFKKAPLT